MQEIISLIVVPLLIWCCHLRHTIILQVTGSYIDL